MISFLLRSFLVFEALWGLLVLLLCGHVLLRLRASRKRSKSASDVRTLIDEHLMVYANGNSDISTIARLADRESRAVEDAILRYHGELNGYAAIRLCELAFRLGFVEQWCQAAHSRKAAVRRIAFLRIAGFLKYEEVRRIAGRIPELALADADPDVQLAAARALAESGDRQSIERAFQFLLNSYSPMVQAVLTPALRRYAVELCETAVPVALNAGSAADLAHKLRLLVSWECSLPLPDLTPLTGHFDAAVRLQALRLLPMLPGTPENETALLRGLSDADDAVILAAVAAAARLKCERAVPLLASCLRRKSARLAKAAAAALAAIPPEGLQVLESHMNNADAIAAEAAREMVACGDTAGGS
jgi:hypothetical protein